MSHCDSHIYEQRPFLSRAIDMAFIRDRTIWRTIFGAYISQTRIGGRFTDSLRSYVCQSHC